MGQSRQYWRAFWPIMHLHENHSTKRAGVAGIRARANTPNVLHMFIFMLFEVMIYTVFSLNGMEVCLM